MKYEKQFSFLILFGALLLTFTNCNPSTSETPPPPAGPYVCASTPVTKGSRQFGMDILDVPSVGSYNDNLANLKTLGGQFQTLHLNWNQIEAAGSGVTSGAFSDPSNALSALNALAVSDGIKVTLRIPGADTNFWLDYADFLFEMNVHMVNNFPAVKIGFVLTTKGATDTTFILPSSGGQKAVDIFAAWMGAVDLLGLTYYPLTTGMTMKPNSEVAALFQNLVAFTNKPIHIEEVGYSSSATTVGTEALQAEFFCEVLKAWDTHAAKIPSLSALRMDLL